MGGLERALQRRARGAQSVQVQMRHYRFAGEVRSSGRPGLLRSRLPQEPLPPGMAEALQRELARRGESAATDLRALLEDVIHLCLSLGSVRPSTPLAELAENLLGAADGEGKRSALPPALQRSAQLSHLQALYLELERGPDGGADLA